MVLRKNYWQLCTVSIDTHIDWFQFLLLPVKALGRKGTGTRSFTNRCFPKYHKNEYVIMNDIRLKHIGCIMFVHLHWSLFCIAIILRAIYKATITVFSLIFFPFFPPLSYVTLMQVFCGWFITRCSILSKNWHHSWLS